ncbi:MAG: hypothetical protein WCP69_09510 [Bacteroidota bacterium]
MIKQYLIYIGLIKRSFQTLKSEELKTDKTSDIKEIYCHSKEIKVADRYLTYLKEIHDYQRDRRTTIENKNSQLVGQASIVTSIFALFIPLLINNLSGVSLWLKLPLSFLFLIVLLHYLLSILHAIKTLTVDKYKYPSRSTISITKKERKEIELDFVNSEIEDLIYIINNTTPIDNIKGDNLIYGARCFKIGNIGFGIMTILVIASTLFLKKEISDIKVTNLNEFKLLVPATLNKSIFDLQFKDNITIKIDSLNNKIFQVNSNSEKKSNIIPLNNNDIVQECCGGF